VLNSADRPSFMRSCRRSASSTITSSAAIAIRRCSSTAASHDQSLTMAAPWVSRAGRPAPKRLPRSHPGGRAWPRILSGRRLVLRDPSPVDIEIEDIAHGLARVARWNGQTSGAHIYSVAQHCLLVEALARARVSRLDNRHRLAVLLHDAPEYVIGDMISPF